MAERGARRPKLLFVLSTDYGELANALSLLAGQPFEAVLLMPDRLFAVNRGTLPVTAYRYGSPSEVTDHVRRERPDVVFLFSGYLYVINHIFSLKAVEALVRELGRGDHRLVTSDPFLGILSDLDGSTFSDRLPRHRWLLEHFGRLARLFRTIPHLYPVKADDFARTPSVSFFNEHILLSPDGLAAHRRKLAKALALDPSGRRWLFVLSLEDYDGQASMLGRDRFDERLIHTLHEAIRAGRQPVLVAPPAAIAAVRHRSAAIQGLVTVPFCSYDLFMSLLMDAEHVFYWNIFSNSIPARMLNHRPVFFFDPGHLVRASPALADVGRKRYYAGSEPPYLDAAARLDADVLAVLARRQDEAMRAAREGFRRCPTPSAMIEQIRRS